MDEQPLEQAVRELGDRVDSLERSVSSKPPAVEIPASAPPAPSARSRGVSRFLDDKIVITGMISLVGIWATIYTNARQMDQQALSSNKQLELETVKYQLGEYLSADDAEERITVLRVIRDTPHTTREMMAWATEQHDLQLKAFIETQQTAATDNAAEQLLTQKAEQDPDAKLTLTPQEKRITEQAGERVAQEIRQQVAKGGKLPTPRERARKIWLEGYEEYNKGNVERAKTLYASSLAADGGYAAPVNSIGRIQLEDQNDPKAAEQSFRRALKHDPEYAPAAYNLVLSLAAQKRGDDAKRELEQAVRIEPGYAKRQAVENAVARLITKP